MSQYDLVVIGTGPGGYVCAIKAAQLGLKTAVIEKRATLGGTCLNIGCIPSKALLHAAKVISDARDMAAHGIRFGDPEIDLDALRNWKGKVVGQLTKGLEGLAKQRKVEVVRGDARFVSPQSLEVSNDGAATTIEFAHAIIAAGSEPVQLPGIPHDVPGLH